MKVTARSTFKLLAWLVVSLILLIAVLLPLSYAWIQSSWGRNWIIRTAQNAFDNQFNAHLHIGSLEGSIPARIILNDVDVTYNDESRGRIDTLIQVSKAEVELQFWDLLYGQVLVSGLHFQNPHFNLIADVDSSSFFRKAFATKKGSKPQESHLSEQIKMYVPSLRIENGSVSISPKILAKSNLEGTFPSNITNINARIFLEILPEQRYLDVQELKVDLPDFSISSLDISGQFFSDQLYTEINKFRVSTPNSSATLNFILEGVDINKRGWTDNLDKTQFKLSIQDTKIDTRDISTFLRATIFPSGSIDVSCNTSGDLISLTMDGCSAGFEGSSIEWDGLIKNFAQVEELDFSFDIKQAKIQKDFIAFLSSDTLNPWFSVIEPFNTKGTIAGSQNDVTIDLTSSSLKGSIQLSSKLILQEVLKYSGQVVFKDLHLEQWPQLKMGNSVLSFTTRFEGSGLDENAAISSESTLIDSNILGVQVQTASLVAKMANKVITLTTSVLSDAGKTNLNARVDLSKDKPSFAIDGEFSELNASTLFKNQDLPKTSINAVFLADINGSRLSDIQGKFSLDGTPSSVNGDSIPSIQAYADLFKLGDEQQFRLTSTFVDAFMSGNYDLEQVINHSQYWFNTIRDQINTEFLQSEETKVSLAERSTFIEPIRLEFSASIKQVELLNRFIKANPIDQANTTISGSILADNQRLLLDLSLFDPLSKINTTTLSNVDIKLTSAFQANSSFGETANIQLLSNIGSIQQGRIKLEDITTKGSILDDTLRIEQNIVGFGNAARASFNIQAALQDSVINVVFPNFFLGNNQYSWKAIGLPAVRLLPDDKIEFLDFKFQNDVQQLNLSGIFSNDPSDILGLDIANVDLAKISDLVGLRFDFAGNMNGSIVSRGLRSRSNVEGHLYIDNVAIDGRILGDVSLDSEYNPESTVFDTELRIVSDFTVDAGKLTETIVSNKIKLSGFIDLDTEDPNVDDLFNFDADFEEVNLWAIRYFLLDVFTSMEGKASGKGSLKGNLNRFEFDSRFTVEDAKVSPVFLNTNYVLNGDLRFNDREGIVFENVRVRDDKRGTGILSGRVDMNDFKPQKYLDLNLRMNRLEFLNNRYDPDVPFYGVVSGSGEVRLSGPNNKPFVQTIRPITVTPNSKLTIPMLDETAINQQTNFIRFVNQFFERSNPLITQTQTKQPNQQTRSFTDIFQLDLQFIMPQDAAIEFIFDPVTNEYLTTRGTGSVRLTLETGNLGMFGTFDIDRGEYNFVGGDIFTKKFKIRPGGTVIWDGLAQDPRIDVVAFYAARPNLSPLGTGRDVRVPIDLVLNLKGRLATIENDFYFAYPTNFDTGLTASELNILNSEAQKLLQATSLLITGNFLPVDSGSNTDQNTQNRITQAGLGQLLSSQINNVLNSSLSNFDFDLNLTGFDQADLGIGLRLFDDRLELRRDGTIVGEQTNIGDLEATYRINRFLSVEIFHRQDINSNRRVTQNGSLDRVNGLGLQYQVQFSSWRRFFADIWRYLSGKQG